MATVYSNPVQIGSYNLIRIRCEYSGTSAWLYVEFSRTSSYTGRWYDYNASLTFNGVEIGAPYDYSGTVGEDWVQITNAGSYPISTAGGTYQWSFYNSTGGTLGCSGSITIPAQGTAPTGLAVSVLSSTDTSVTGSVSITSWGTGGTSHTKRLYLYTYSDTGLVEPSKYRNSSSTYLSNFITVSNSGAGTLNIEPNKQYVVAAYASNGLAATGPTRMDTIVTRAETPLTQSVSSVTETSATIVWLVASDGGFYQKDYYYSLDNGTSWVACGSVPDSGRISKEFTITGLSPATTYTVKFKVVTEAGTTMCDNFPTFTTLGTPGHPLYGSVNGQTKKVKKLYGSVNGQTKLIKHLYGSVNGVTKKIF